MEFKRFEEICVWQDGVDLSVAVFELTAARPFHLQGDLFKEERNGKVVEVVMDAISELEGAVEKLNAVLALLESENGNGRNGGKSSQ